MKKQTYLGVKRVEAYPEERDGNPGYAVIYPDGYKSWSPKAVFEAAYFPIEKANILTQNDIDRMTDYPRQNSSVPPADLNATPITTRR